MRTPVLALLWELWRLLGRNTVVRIGVWGTMVWALFAMAQVYVKLPPWALSLLVLLPVVGLSLGSAVWVMDEDTRRKSGFPYRLGYARPIGTFALVAVPFTVGAFGSGLTYLLPAAAIRYTLDLPLPLLSIFCLVIVVDAAISASLWIPSWGVGRCLSFGALLLITLGSLTHRLRTFGGLDELFVDRGSFEAMFSLSPLGYAALLVIFLVLLGLTVWSIGRQRHGETFSLSFPHIRGTAAGDRQSSEPLRPFRGRLAAQVWMDLRRTFPQTAVTAVVVGLFTALPVCLLADHVERLDPGEGPAIWLVFCFLTGIVAVTAGAQWLSGLYVRGMAMQLSTFEGTLPASIGELIVIKYCALLVCTLTSAMIVAVLGVLWTIGTGRAGEWSVFANNAGFPELASQHPLAILAIAGTGLLALLTFPALVLAAAYTFASQMKVLTAISYYAFFNAVLALANYAFAWSLQAFWWTEAWVLAVGAGLFCLHALYKALTRRYVDARLFAAAFALWLVWVELIGDFVWNKPPVPLAEVPTVVLVAAASALLVPLASTAFAPLALASNRHR